MQNGTLYNFLKYATLNIVYDFLKKLLLSVDKNAITWFFFMLFVLFLFIVLFYSVQGYTFGSWH